MNFKKKLNFNIPLYFSFFYAIMHVNNLYNTTKGIITYEQK